MNSMINSQIFELLITGQRSYTDICRQCGGSPSNVSAHLREMLANNEVIKSRVGKNVFYALRGHDLKPEESSNRLLTLETLSMGPPLQFHDLLVKCPTLERSDLSKALANLVFDGKVFRHRKENSRVTYYSTSNFEEGLLLVNPRRRNQCDAPQNIGPYLREFLFGLPLPV